MSANGSPLQLIHAGAGSAAVQMLPWSLIPTVLVPFYLITHGIILSQLFAQNQAEAFPLPIGQRVMGQALLLTGNILKGRAHYDEALRLYDPVKHGLAAARSWWCDFWVITVAFGLSRKCA